MTDSRGFHGRDVRRSWRLAAAVINLAYAKRHGYDFEVLQLPSRTNASADGVSSTEDTSGCWHPVFGDHPDQNPTSQAALRQQPLDSSQS